MSGPLVVIAENGFGVPVTPVESGAPVVTLSESGRGTPIVISDNATPMVIEGNAPPIVPGPLDVVERAPGSFTNFSREFGLASDCAVLGLACAYTGTPVITITHGGEPLTIVQDRRRNGTIALLAVGVGLTVEVADLEISATGGTLDGGVLRINEMQNIDPALTGWESGADGQNGPIPRLVMSGTDGGVVKGVFANNGADRIHASRVEGADTVFNGFIVAGPSIPDDFSTSGAWVLGAGWSIDGDDFVHTGPSSELRLAHTLATSTASTQCHIDVADVPGNMVNISGSGSDVYGPGSVGYVSSAASSQSECVITATGDVRISELVITTGGKIIAWVLFTAAAVDGASLQAVMAYNPAWAIVAAEVLGQDYP